MVRKIILLFLILSSTGSLAQTKTLDSLKKAIDNYQQQDTVKIKMLRRYSVLLQHTDIQASIRFINETIHLANKLNRPDLALGAVLWLSDSYGRENRYDSALLVLLDGLNTAERLHLNNMLPGFYAYLAEIYRLLDNFPLAEYYNNKYLDAGRSIKNDTITLFALQDLMVLYMDNDRWDKLKNILSQTQPLAMALKFEAVIANVDMANAKQYDHQKNYQEAINSNQAALEIWTKQDNHPAEAYTLGLISNLFLRAKNKDSARWYAYAAIDTAKKYQLKKETGDAYSALFNYHYQIGDYKKALEERLIIDSMQKETTNPQTEQTALRAEMKYDQEKKDYIASFEQAKKEAAARTARNLTYGIITVFILLAAFLMYTNRQKQKAKTKIENAYRELKSTQSQLIQSEKMASLGELTAGIAHEIQNPLNFVNNFSEVNAELLNEMQEHLDQGHYEEIKAIARDIQENELRINQHGKRADGIVKGMLQHSRSSTGAREPTDINALADEYLRLSYHGLRAREKSFNATMQTSFDPSIGTVNIVPQDMGRVLLNLYNNAFYATSEKKKTHQEGYEPTVSVATKKVNDKVEIRVMDNGNGIPEKVVDKIFQPFFTTKPTGQGTGLGLSLSYDIIRAHGGQLRVHSKEGEYAEFVIELPE